MKKSSIILTVAFLISACFSVQQVSSQEKTKPEQEKQFSAQDKSKTEQEKDIKLQQTIEQQKKAMKNKLDDLVKKGMITEKEALEESKNIDENLEKMNYDRDKRLDQLNYMRSKRSSGNVLFSPDQQLVFSPGIEYFGDSYRPFSATGDSERTTWDFTKSVKETTFSREYSFDVEESASTVVMTIMGDCKSGEIRVIIIMPGGKTYSDIVIDEFGNLNWRKSFTISEDENKDKAGEWIFKIDASNATGYFKISLQTY